MKEIDNNIKIKIQKLKMLGYNVVPASRFGNDDIYTISIPTNCTDIDVQKILDDKLDLVSKQNWLTTLKIAEADICIICKNYTFKQEFNLTFNRVVVVNSCSMGHFSGIIFKNNVNYCKNFK
jgi:hypothetical protein